LRIKFLIYSVEGANKINRRFVWIGQFLNKVFINVKYDLDKANIPINSEKYITASFFSAVVYGLISFLFFYFLFFARDGVFTAENSILSALIGVVFTGLFFMLHLAYPSIMSKNYAAGIDNSLIFALNNMLIQVSSGVSLFSAMSNVSKFNYGNVSKEFENVVKDVSSGESEAKAIEKLALKTRSEYLKKISWQLLTSLRSGASLKGSLSTVVSALNAMQIRAIKNYAGELSMLILMYLMIAAAIPTLGITFLVILSSMGGASIGPDAVISVIIGAAIMQIVLIGFIKTRVPKVYL